MSVRVHIVRTRTKGFTMIPNDLLRDPRMTPKARGILVTLLSHDDDWIKSAHSLLKRESVVGREQVTTALNELRELGYVEDTYHRESTGTVQRTLTLRDVSPWHGNTVARETRGTETPSIEVEPQDPEEPLEEEPQNLTLAPAARERDPKRDPIWDAFVEIYGSPTSSARKGWNVAAAVLRQFGATAEQIHAMVGALGGTDKAWAVVTPNALAKHFGQRDRLATQDAAADPVARHLAEAAQLAQDGR